MMDFFGLRWIANAFLDRASLIRAKGMEGKKDVDVECEYPPEITPDDYWSHYRRNGIARRVVNVLPEQSWRQAPEIYEVEDQTETPFEAAVKDFITKYNIFHYLETADKVSGIGEYGLLFFGLDDGKKLEQPIDGVQADGTIKPTTKKHNLLFLRVIPRNLADIKTWETNQSSTRFGQPLTYSIKFGEIDEQNLSASVIGGETIVHWSRVIHCADNRISSEVFGTPRMEPVFNYLLDIKKTLGGSAEMFWKGGFPGLSIEMNPDVASQIAQLPQTEQDEIKTNMKKEYQDYQQGLQRFMALIGAKANSLAVQVADPKPQFDAQVTAICITIDIPKPIFIGAETGELASQQNTKKWNDTLKNRQTKYLIPMLIRAFFDRMIVLNILPTPLNTMYIGPTLALLGNLTLRRSPIV
jgi:hypothetical protein